jgi:hypothetical protein
MTRSYAYALVLALLLVGCKNYSFNDYLGAAYASVEAVAQTVEQACGAYEIGGECRGSISTAKRDDARDLLRQALLVLDEAGRTRDADLLGQARGLISLAGRIVGVEA